MENQDHTTVSELIEWINCKLRFIDKIIAQARACSNYGKEIQYVGMRDAYLEFLKKLDFDQEGEKAA